jgi:hypothetical protein
MPMRPLCLAALILAGCPAETGDCPSVTDCACPCSDANEPVCATDGTIYQNRCVLECNAATEGTCPGGASPTCAQECAGQATAPVCGVSGTTNQCFDNTCLRDCAGFTQTQPSRCTPRCS